MNKSHMKRHLLQLFAEGEAAPAGEAPAEEAVTTPSRQPQEPEPMDEAESFARSQMARWNAQANRAREIYPNLDLSAESRNPYFCQLLRSGLDVETAYTVVHRDQILTSAMHHAARVARQQLSSAIQSGVARPAENGLLTGGPASVQSVAHLTRQQRDNIRSRAAKGEKIRF